MLVRHNRSLSRFGFLECLESRVLLSSVHTFADRSAPWKETLREIADEWIASRRRHALTNRANPVAIVNGHASPNATTPPGNAFTPAQIRQAYGFDQVRFGSTQGDGTGQTIAIIDAYDDPNIIADLNTFDTQFGLPAPPSFTKVAQNGSANFPAASGSTNWSIEESLDVEWAHAAAPGAKIILVEAVDSQYQNLVQAAATWAARQPGVSTISMSFGSSEFGSETGLDSFFTTPAGHPGVTFLASTGDSGSPTEYPAASPNVVAVGGTSLSLTSSNAYNSETGWSGSGGGISNYEAKPTYQDGIATQSDTARTNPDISAVADPQTGVAVYDSYDFASSPWIRVGGTSLSAPLMAGMVAIADQGRATLGLTSLDGPSQTLPLLYQLPAGDFHDVLTGSNANANFASGYSAATGYDLVTGRGSPIVNKLVYGLMGASSVSGTVFQDNNTNNLKDATDPALSGVTVYLDSNNDGVLETGATNTVSNTSSMLIPDASRLGASSSIQISGTTDPISNLSVTLTIGHARDSDLTIYLIAPDGNQIALADGVGGNGSNFSGTTFSDQASTGISSGAAPFSGTYRPKDALADFNGKSANGTWKLRVADTVSGNTGTLQSWSLSVTTGTTDVWTTTSNAAGAYSFANLPLGASYNIREIVPAGDVLTTPNGGSGYATAPLFTAITGQNFGNFSTIFNTTTNSDSYYVAVDPSDTFLQISTGTTPSSTPTYQIALAKLPSLTFNLSGTDNILTIDFTNGSPIPGGNISLNATAASNDELRIFGQNPSQLFTMTDTQIGPTAGGIVFFQNLPTLTLDNSTTHFTGTLNTLQNLNINTGETFFFD